MKFIQGKYIFLYILSISIISSKKIIIDYNEELDFIVKDGKYYFPLPEEKSVIKMKNLRTLNNYKQTRTLEEEKKGEEKIICEEEMVSGGKYWFFMFMVAFLTLFAGMMSGLTVGYLSVDKLTMELREKTGTQMEKEYSKIILPVLSNHHWLLCTLLLMN
jgi:hypothetical protein